MHSRLASCVLITIGVLFASTAAIAQTSYTSNANGAWNTATTWSPNGIPGAIDSVTITGAHTVTLDSTRSITNVTVNGALSLSSFTLSATNAPGITGTLTGAGGSLTISGTGDWSAGTLNAISLNVLSGGTLTVSGGSTKVLQASAQLVVGGTANWTGGQILNNSGSLISIQRRSDRQLDRQQLRQRHDRQQRHLPQNGWRRNDDDHQRHPFFQQWPD
jgi:hypothetical protein